MQSCRWDSDSMTHQWHNGLTKFTPNEQIFVFRTTLKEWMFIQTYFLFKFDWKCNFFI